MADPLEVLTQAGRLRSGTRFERARAGATALSTFLQLSPQDKRDLAVLVAQRVAPELVPRIQSETGVDLTQEQSRAVLDMIARLDGDDLQELTSSLATADARTATLGVVTASAARATGLDDVVAEPAGEGHDAPSAVPVRDTESSATEATVQRAVADHPDDFGAAQSATLAGRIADVEARLAAAEATARTAEASLAQARQALAAREDRIDQLEARLRDRQGLADDLRRAHEGELHDLRRQLRRATREVEESGGSSMSTRAIAARAPAPAPSTSAFASLPGWGEPTTMDTLPDTVARPVGRHAGDLVGQLEGATPSTALRLVRARLPQLGTSTPGDRAQVLQAIPDGWARRRALQRMAEAGLMGREDLSSLRLLGRTGDQVFAATSLLDAGLPRDAVAAHLAPAARARLARRAA